jgi:predicted PurR-regulated permease PerM
MVHLRDKNIFKLLESCIGVTDSILQGLKHKEDLQKRLDSKSVLGEYMGLVYELAAYFITDERMVINLLDSLVSPKISLNDSTLLADIVTFVSRFASKVVFCYLLVLLAFYFFLGFYELRETISELLWEMYSRRE